MESAKRNGQFATAAFLLASYLGCYGILLFPSVRESGGLAATLIAVNCLLLLSAGLLFRKRETPFRLLNPPVLARHLIIQALVQTTVFIYAASNAQGWEQTLVEGWVPLLLYQFCFAFVFDFLLSVKLRGSYTFGLSILPLVLSINLFLWVKPPYFGYQLLIIALGLVAKGLIVRRSGPQRSHIFNPSAFVLAIASVLILAFDLKRYVAGAEIGALYLHVPHFDVLLILLAACTLWLPNAFMVPLGASLFFFGAEFLTQTFAGMPLMYATSRGSVLIGITLLITDPRTSPASQAGKFFFGMIYALGIAAAYWGLSALSMPTFYGKILVIPFLNYFSPRFDLLFPSKVSGREAPDFYRPRLASLAVYLILLFAIVAKLSLVRTGPYFLDFHGHG